MHNLWIFFLGSWCSSWCLFWSCTSWQGWQERPVTIGTTKKHMPEFSHQQPWTRPWGDAYIHPIWRWHERRHNKRFQHNSRVLNRFRLGSKIERICKKNQGLVDAPFAYRFLSVWRVRSLWLSPNLQEGPEPTPPRVVVLIAFNPHGASKTWGFFFNQKKEVCTGMYNGT